MGIETFAVIDRAESGPSARSRACLRSTASGVVIALAAGVAGTTLLAPAATAADYPVANSTEMQSAVTAAGTDAGFVTFSLLNDIVVDNVLLTPALTPQVLTIDTTGGYTLTLNGAGTVWNAGSYTDFAIDGATDGGLTLSSGARLKIDDNPNNSQPYGFLDLRTGNLKVTGAGTSLTSNYLSVGRGGNGTVEITDGAHVISGSATLGEDPGSTTATSISVLVDGPGTLWEADYFAAGVSGGNADLTLSGGAMIDSNNAAIGRNGSASMLVTGAGTSFVVAGDLHVGERSFWLSDPGLGDGALTISDGGLVSASSVRLGWTGTNTPDAGVTGALVVDTGGTLETGELAPGLGTGTATFNNGTLRATGNDVSLIHGFAYGDLVLEGSGMFLDSNGFDVVAESAMSGAGALTKEGAGKLTLTGHNTYGGVTHVTSGTLAAGDENVFSANSAHRVAMGTLLDLQGFDQTVASLDNAGTVRLGGAPGTVLTVTGNYAGSAGVILVNTALGDDNSVTDRVVIGGNTSGTGSIKVTNIGGTGAQTNQGIRIIDVADGSTSAAAFTLIGDYSFEGEQAVVGGAYAYRLYQNSPAGPDDGDWYLRSTLIPTGPDPLYQAGVPLYETYPQLLAAFNRLGTLQQRVGNRSWSGNDGTVGVIDLGRRQVEAGGAWARIEGAYAHDGLDTTSGGTTYDSSLWRLQAGMDGLVQHSDEDALVAGAYVDYGVISADVASVFGSGSISTTGFGVGGTLTWYDADGLYVDGVAQLRWFDSSLHSTTADLDLVDGNGGLGLALSVEAGRQVALDGNWSITPQAQLIYSAVGFDDFTDAFGAALRLNDGGGLTGRLGVTLDYDDSSEGDNGLERTHWYGIANLYYELDNSTEIEVSGTALKAGADQLSGELGVGGSYDWDDDKYSLYGEASVRTRLDDLGASYGLNGNLGMRIRW
jgi:fibronectin-binding autotransporter adhesin